MKNIIKVILVLVCINITSCEDVVDVTVPTAKSKLVIEASLDWQKGTEGNNQTIMLSTSTPYFDANKTNPALGAVVKVTNQSSNIEYLFEDQNNGTYTISNFVPVLNDIYTLEIEYDGETYVGKETLTPVSNINRVEQSLEGGFDDEVLDITLFWDDPADEVNFYLLKLLEEGDFLPILEDLPDEFVNGNEISEFFEKDRDEDDDQKEFNPGDVVDIYLYGISEQYFNYISLLIEQYDSGGDPFSAIPAKIKGNCVNQTSPENYPFGYFRVTEFDTVNYTFVEQE